MENQLLGASAEISGELNLISKPSGRFTPRAQRHGAHRAEQPGIWLFGTRSGTEGPTLSGNYSGKGLATLQDSG